MISEYKVKKRLNIRISNLLVVLAVCFLYGCARDNERRFSLLYQIDIQQGNVVEQEMLNKLRAGMDKEQVRFIMGSPTIIDPFHSNRWEYIFSYQQGGGADRARRRISLHFEGEQLVGVSGDVKVGTSYLEADPLDEQKTIVIQKDTATEGTRKGMGTRTGSGKP